MIRFFIVILSAWLLGGCAGLPIVPKQVSLPPGSRVGVVVEIPNRQYQSHVGATIFNNFSSTYAYEWNVQQPAEERLLAKLKQGGYEPVALAAHGMTGSQLKGLVEVLGIKWIVPSDKQAYMDRLRNELNLQAVLVITTGRALAAIECFGGPCNTFTIPGPGIFSRSVLGSPNYVAVSGLHANLYLLNPPTNFDHAPAFTALHGLSGAGSAASPRDPKNVAAEEFERVRYTIEGHIDSIGYTTVEALQGKYMK